MRLKWLKNGDGSITHDEFMALINKGTKLSFQGDEKKHDGWKAPMDLLPWDALEMVAQVMAHGAKRYGENSWQKVEGRRYEAAMLRHYAAYKCGGTVDSDSGLLHLAHMACNAIFILALEIRKNEVKGG